MHRSPTGILVPLDLEIEATLRRNKDERRRKLLQDRTVASILEEETHFSDSPSSRECTNQLSETATMADEHDQRTTLEDSSSSSVPQFFTSIARPEVQPHNITYPHSLIHLIQGNLFQGLPNEDPYAHLATFIEICNTVKTVGVPDEAIRLSLFSFSLAGEAKRWLHSFKGKNLKTWEEVVEKFLKKYFPESKTAEGKATIFSFHQFPDESLSEAWDETTNQAITRCFYWGKIKLKTPEEATELIENMLANDYAILRDITHQPTKKILLELTSHDALLAQNKLLSKQLEIMPTRMTLQLADRSITRPYGVIEDVLVRVKHFIFPVKFVVMDISEDTDIPVILGRPFMLTASCIVDMGKRKLELGFED
ncbi:hypothetical protein GYH30_015935 [Glycine max]|nr:hypothetical protein GYH30_015935 [Glycine max]